MAKTQIRKLFTNDEIIAALQTNNTLVSAAKELSKLRGVPVSSPILRYWRKQLEYRKKDGTPYDSASHANKSIRSEMELRAVGMDDYDRTGQVEHDNDVILVIPDQHAPYNHEDAIPFLADVAERINPTRIINLGDEADNHALSMHDSDPNLDSAGTELTKARIFLKELAELFPIMDVCHSNHGSLVYRRAMKFGIPVEYIKSYRDILFTNGDGDLWEWKEKVKVILPNNDLVIFQHQSSGDILANAAHDRANIVEGHEHATFEIRYKSSATALYWSMTSGCLVAPKSLAFAYGKQFPKKPIIGCSAIIDSQPVLIPMPQTDDGRYTGKLGGIYLD